MAEGFKPVGGVMLRNKHKEIVFWFKQKEDLAAGRSFGLVLYHPELVDSEKARLELEDVFQKIRVLALASRIPLFDMSEFEREMKKTLKELGVGAKEYVRSRRVEDMTFKLTDLVSGRKEDVTFGIRPARPRRKRRGERA